MTLASIELPNPDDLQSAQAFDCVRRLRAASEEVNALVRDYPELREQVERILQEAWSGTGRFRDL